MTKRNDTQPDAHEIKRSTERPERETDSDTLEGPGGLQESKAEADALNKTTRRGER